VDNLHDTLKMDGLGSLARLIIEEELKVPPKQSTSFRLSDEALCLIRELSESLGLSQAAVVEMAVRKLAREEKG
jgi:hypothetical protein